MFGLEKDKKGKEEFLFDLEVEAKQPGKGRELKEKAVICTKEVKNLLRSGQNKEEFNQFGALLLGYNALQKVLSRVIKN